MYQYADTVEFDLMVVFLVVCVMPLAVFLMQSKTKVGRAISLALMVLAILYVGADREVGQRERLGLDEVEERGWEHSSFQASLGHLRPVHPVVLEAADVEDGEDHERQ